MFKKLFLLFFMICILPNSAKANIAEIAPQPCDPGFFKQMTARAWLESEREIMQNQNLIFKPDSVLEYTCFDRFANITAWAGGNVFTHSKYFGKPLIPRGPLGLETILQKIIYNTLKTYRDNNFSHSLLGGRGEFMGLDLAPGTEFFPITTPLAYSCSHMHRVWKTSKCANFIHNAEFKDNAGFYPFESIECPKGATAAQCNPVEGYTELPNDDVREYPTTMARCAGEEGPLTWEDASVAAENRGEPLYKFQTPLGKIFGKVLDKIKPGNCGKKAIGTGVMVIIADEPSHADGVCTNPGCTYKKGGLKKPGTCVK